ncbi:TolC family protein [Fulvivirga ulvae]|uniref:TolC family protein n=1 Tax=Fulvivirga ulvae TaxID=2904245 RepID=UPI001F47E2CF|nr:TolC family protein [Fulvivirga ulvae]UII30485.1 TolC family protein [Fulvivirga ulvae]
MQFISYITLILPVFALIASVAGCSPKISGTSLPIDSLQEFSYSGDQHMPEKWWTSFENPDLNTLVDSALTSNFELESVWHQLLAARAVVNRETSNLLPDIEATVQSAINRPQPDFVGGENIRFGLNAAYEVDLWGRIRSQVEAERFREKASYADYQSAAITLSAEIVLTWYQIIAAQNQLQLVNEQVDTNEKIVKLIRARFGSGLIRGVDILRQQQLLEATREQKIVAESRFEILKHQLAVLLGRQPQTDFNVLSYELPEPPPLPQTGIPMEQIRRRPDVQQAYNLLKAADKDLAAAISNQYPRLSLTATASMRANNADDLFQNWARSLAGNLVAPLFYGGRLSAEVDRSEAVKNQRLYEYGQTVLIAFREVEDALIQEIKQNERIEVLKEQHDLARKTYEQLQTEYFNGLSNYLDVLTALGQEQQLRRELIAARYSLLEFRINLYRSLAGGFDTERETEDE